MHELRVDDVARERFCEGRQGELTSSSQVERLVGTFVDRTEEGVQSQLGQDQ